MALLQHEGLCHLDDDQKQDDGTESTGNHVQEGEIEDLDGTSALTLQAHGQSFDGVRKAPPLSTASCQKAAAA